jgi:hypothetical protein
MKPQTATPSNTLAQLPYSYAFSFSEQVAKSRTMAEEQIHSTLLNIKDRLPGVKLYQDMYSDDHELDRQLRSKILDAYGSFIVFCMAAVEYFTRGRARMSPTH